MNLIFFGSSKFALPALSRVIYSPHKIIYVVTQPDRQAGRGMKLISTPVKQLSEKFNLPLHQTEDVNSKNPLEFLKSLHPDLFCVVAFGQILSQDILAIPKILCLNLHASLLPKYRGAAPINWALIKGETQTGVSIIKMSAKLDVGPIILQRSLDIKDNDHAQTLEGKLSTLGADLLLEALDLIQAKKYNLTIQDELKATFAPRLKKTDGLINWEKSAQDIINLIRGCAGWPGAFTYYQGKILKIHKARLFSFASLPVSPAFGSGGRILEVSRKGIVLATGEGNLLIEELQIEGKKKTTVEEFISGYRISVGETLGEKK